MRTIQLNDQKSSTTRKIEANNTRKKQLNNEQSAEHTCFDYMCSSPCTAKKLTTEPHSSKDQTNSQKSHIHTHTIALDTNMRNMMRTAHTRQKKMRMKSSILRFGCLLLFTLSVGSISIEDVRFTNCIYVHDNRNEIHTHARAQHREKHSARSI